MNNLLRNTSLITVTAWLFLSLSGVATCAIAQGTKADYERSKSLTQRVADRVTREQLQTHWREDGSFWYRVKTGPGSQFEWVDVNPVKGQNGNTRCPYLVGSRIWCPMHSSTATTT